MCGLRDGVRSSEQQHTHLIMRYRRSSYPPLRYLLLNTRATATEVLVEVLMAYRGVDTTATAVEVILMADMIVAAVLIRNIREVLIRNI